MVQAAASIPAGPGGSDSGNAGMTEPERIVIEANERFKSCKEWQGTEDERSREDIKFANADARNMWQWGERVQNSRGVGTEDELPCLTINTTRVHNDLIINDICKQDFGITVRPVGGKASYQSAQMMMALIRRIQDQSTFTAQRRKVAEHQVDGGVGHMMLETRYVSERSFDQDIYLKAALDPTCVYEDPWIREPDGSDKNFKFEFERMPRKEFNRKYPKYADKVGSAPVDSAFSDWMSDKEITLVKYWRKKAVDDTLIAYEDDNKDQVERLKSEIIKTSGQNICDLLLAEIKSGQRWGRMRDTTNNAVEWFLIAGDQVVEQGEWAGKYVPGARCVGRELVIDRTLDRKGHTRPLINPQQMLNYAASSDVQYGFSQTKSQWMASSRAIEGQEQWKSANVDNFSVMVWNDVEEDAPEGLQQIAPPTKIPPAGPNPAYQAMMQSAERHIMMISGQWQAQMGENDQQSANSGKAINARKMQADTATYHFFEHQSDMLRLLGKQLLDLIPKIYDTERVLKVIGDRGEKFRIRIDPNMKDAVQELQHEKDDEDAIRIAFNPNLGEYECISDPGPDYATQRQEAYNALSQIFTQAKDMVAVAGDLLFKNSDFKGADEVFERLQKEIQATKPYLFDDNAQTPAVAEMNAQVQKLTALNSELMQKLAIQEVKHRGYQEKRDVDAFKAETERMKATVEALTKILLTPAQREQLEHEVAQDGRQHVYTLIQQANQAALTPEPEAEGAE